MTSILLFVASLLLLMVGNGPLTTISLHATFRPQRLNKIFRGCDKYSELFPKRKSKITWLSSAQMQAIIKKAVEPEFPKSCRCRGTIVVYVLVDAQGKVVCSRTLSGHPLLQAASLQAVRQWEFEPLVDNGQAVPFAGSIAFKFDASGWETIIQEGVDVMTKTINLDENLSLQAVLALARNGDEVVIEENGEPLARLLPVTKPEKRERLLGLREGQVWLSDDFAAPLPDSFWLGEEA